MRPSSRIVFMGVSLAFLGVLALTFATTATLASVFFLGAILFVAGIAEIAYGLQGRKNGELWPYLGLGILAIACAFLISRNPVENTMGLTLMVSFLLIASGLTKLIGAMAERYSGWGWVASSGVISVGLGGLILWTFPVSAFFTIGTFVGIDLIVAGLSFIGLGVSMKQIRRDIEERSAPSDWGKAPYRRPKNQDSETSMHP